MHLNVDQSVEISDTSYDFSVKIVIEWCNPTITFSSIRNCLNKGLTKDPDRALQILKFQFEDSDDNEDNEGNEASMSANQSRFKNLTVWEPKTEN